MEWLSTLFLVMFLFGLLFCAATVLLGIGHLTFGHFGLHGFDGHAGGPAVGHVHGGVGQAGEISPWNLTGLTAFVAWAGGVGYLALNDWQQAAWVAVLLAAVAGLIGWAAIFLFFNRVLYRGERVMNPDDYRLEGRVARVTMPIVAGRTGEIQYEMGGSRRSDGARSLDGGAIERDAEVVIVRYEGGLAYVQPWKDFVDGEGPAPAGR